MISKDELLKNRIRDLAMQAERQSIYTTTRFLSPIEQSIVLSVRASLPVPFRLYGGSDAAIRKLAVFGSEEDFGYAFESPIRILHVRPRSAKFAEELSHRDYLGSMMALQIDRELTGDIIVRDTEAWIFVLEGIVSFLCENLTRIRHTEVICEEVTGEVPELAPRFRQMQINVASERLDLLLAAASGQNREDAKKLIKEEKVFINGLPARSAGQKLSAGDELVIRGFGKFIYDGISATTRKGRCNITMRQYI